VAVALAAVVVTAASAYAAVAPMLHILAQRDVEMAWSGDQEVVEAFPSQGADEAFRDGIRPGCPDRCSNDPHVSAGEDGIEGRGELAVPVTDQEPEPGRLGRRDP
jgi:hypothetical protein